MPQRPLVERQELHPDARGIGVRREREVGTLERGPGTDRREEVLHEREVEHLLLGNVDQLPTPAPRRVELILRETFVVAILEREGGVEVLAHHQLLERGGLAERPDQRLAVLQDHRRLARDGAAACREELHQPAAGRRCRRFRHAPSLSAAGTASLGARGLPPRTPSSRGA